jgi:hypothetical protein
MCIILKEMKVIKYGVSMSQYLFVIKKLWNQIFVYPELNETEVQPGSHVSSRVKMTQ